LQKIKATKPDANLLPTRPIPRQFRGFTGTFRSFEVESRGDKDKGFQVTECPRKQIGCAWNLEEFSGRRLTPSMILVVGRIDPR
jgi:hypothetical protein